MEDVDLVKDNIRRADFHMLKEYTIQLVDEIVKLQERYDHQMVRLIDAVCPPKGESKYLEWSVS